MKTNAALFLGLFSFLIVSSLAASTAEVQALIDLYVGTNGDNWTAKTNWKQGDPCTDKWYGVVCDADNVNVIKLDLESNNLRGTISPTFSDLSNLESITFENNYLSGAFPDAFFGLVNIKILDLNLNNFAGQLPDKFDSFKRLEYFDILGNKLTGSVPPTVLNNLSNCYIKFSINELTSIPWDQWTNKDGLANSTLNVSSNLLAGTLSPQIYWPSLIILDSNKLSGTLPDFDTTNGVSSIKHLSIGNNLLTGNLPESLTKATNLNYIFVTSNVGMKGQIPTDYASMTSLTSLYFFNTSLTCPSNSQWKKFEDNATTNCSGANPDGISLAWKIAIFVSTCLFFLIVVVGLTVAIVFRYRKSKSLQSSTPLLS